MNRIEYLINNPHEVDINDINLLNAEIEKYPYFYSLRALKLLALKKANDDDFEKQLEITATINNKGLFDFISSSGNNLKSKDDFENLIQEVKDSESYPTFHKTISKSEDIVSESTEEELVQNTIITESIENSLDTIEDIITFIENENITDSIENSTQFSEQDTILEQDNTLSSDNIFNEIDTIESDLEVFSNQNEFELIDDMIKESIENSIHVTDIITTNNEIISQAIEETKDVISTSDFFENLEQVDLVNRTKENISVSETLNQNPILKSSPFIILNPDDVIVRGNHLIKENTEKFEEVINEEVINEEVINEEVINEEVINEEVINEEVINEEIDINTDSFSFNDWLKIPSSNTIENDKEQKFQVIEEFLEKKPKITPLKKQEIPEQKNEVKALKQSDFSDLMTETLAQIYIEQKQYEKAIKAYKILILKYPEKNSLFANQIKEIEILKNSK